MSWMSDLNSGPSRSKQFAGKQTNLEKLIAMPWGLVALIIGLAILGTAMLYSSTITNPDVCLLYTSPSPRDKRQSRMPSSA